MSETKTATSGKINIIDKAIKFNEYFQSNFSDVTHIQKDNSQQVSKIKNFHFKISYNESKLENLDFKKARKPDIIGNPLMKKLICSFSKSLHPLFRTLSNKCVFPSTWKVSEIVFIFKAGNKQIVFKYCPMNFLTVKPKALEKLLFDKLIFSSELIISSSHYGFRPKKFKIHSQKSN